MSTIIKTDFEFTREKLKGAFGFKGRYLTELWQTAALIRTENHTAVAPATQSVLWSDGAVFGENPPAAANLLMASVTAHALRLLEGRLLERPDLMLDSLIPPLYEYAGAVCGRAVAPTFVLNSLVGVDIALWSLYARENGLERFDDIIPPYARAAMSEKHSALAHIPLVSYGVGESELKRTLGSGAALLKIKIGRSFPDSASAEEDMERMVEWDCRRLEEIHRAANGYTTPYTKDGRVLYYLDANGRYDCKGRLERLLDHARSIGALERIALLEEPFAPDDMTDVSDLPVTVNADESAHGVEDVKARLALGYRAVALKPIAKTLSVSFRMAAAVHEAGAQCLCADLTVNPFLAQWNKQFAARTGALDKMNIGCVEVNGDSNYVSWELQKSLLPAGVRYRDEAEGVFTLDREFYEKSGALFGENGYFSLFS